MFAKGYTDIRAMIETQYGILSQMVTDIACRSQAQLKGTEEEVCASPNREGYIISICHQDVTLALLLFRKRLP